MESPKPRLICNQIRGRCAQAMGMLRRFQKNVHLSDEILDQAVRAYRSLRNSIRFQLGAINDFSRSDHFVPVSEMSMIDLGQ